MSAHELSRTEARRIAVRAQLLDAERPTGGVLDVVRHLNLLQVEPTAVVAPTADLVLWSRLGAAYDPTELADAVDSQLLVELQSMLRPREDLALFRAEMAQWPGAGPLRPWQEDQLAWVRANDACRRDLLERLRGDGPLPASQLPDTCAVPWTSTGWTHDKNVPQLLKLMALRGEVASAGREGREKLWDLAERIYPDDPVPSTEEAQRELDVRRLRSLGLIRGGQAGEPAVVEGVRGRWRVDPDQLDRLECPFAGRTALLSPLDRLVFDRRRMAELFEFDYQLEMYKPAARRRWGFWALPVLHGDRLVGKVDATADRAAGVLHVDAVHEDEPFAPATRAAVAREIADLAHWLGVEVHLPE